MKVLVCGGRDYGHIDWKVEKDTMLLQERVAQWYHAISILDDLPKEDLVIISGMAKGADTVAAAWAVSNNITLEAYPAKWDEYGKAAGIIRNTEMLEEGEPDLMIAFSGGIGTDNMIKQSKNCGVEVRIIT